MSTKRVYTEELVIDSDTFKLEVSNFSKNLSFDDKRPLLIGVEHCHFFHTFDSSGKHMTTSNQVGGHHHEVTVREDKNGKLLASCGPAIPANFGDNHTHKTTYLKSDRFKVRKMNDEAQRVIAGLSDGN